MGARLGRPIRDMRVNAVVAVLALGLAGGVARADDSGVTGSFDIKYDEVSNNCDHTGMSLARGAMTIAIKNNELTVDITHFPLMRGSLPKSGKVSAKSRLGPTEIQGLDGIFSVAGRVTEGMLQLVFVAEWSTKGRGLCTQSWNISGLRSDKVDKK